jgi:hypothetical protein
VYPADMTPSAFGQMELHTHLQRLGELQDELADHKKKDTRIKRVHLKDLAAQRIALSMDRWVK